MELAKEEVKELAVLVVAGNVDVLDGAGCGTYST